MVTPSNTPATNYPISTGSPQDQTPCQEPPLRNRDPITLRSCNLPIDTNKPHVHTPRTSEPGCQWTPAEDSRPHRKPVPGAFRDTGTSTPEHQQHKKQAAAESERSPASPHRHQNTTQYRIPPHTLRKCRTPPHTPPQNHQKTHKRTQKHTKRVRKTTH